MKARLISSFIAYLGPHEARYVRPSQHGALCPDSISVNEFAQKDQASLEIARKSMTLFEKRKRHLAAQ